MAARASRELVPLFVAPLLVLYAAVVDAEMMPYSCATSLVIEALRSVEFFAKVRESGVDAV